MMAFICLQQGFQLFKNYSSHYFEFFNLNRCTYLLGQGHTKSTNIAVVYKQELKTFCCCAMKNSDICKLAC